jgi:outer membrane protein assembly factor BamB
VVCLGTTSGEDPIVRIELVDPADGTFVRTTPLGFGADSIGLAGDTVIAHGTAGPATPRWDGIDAISGATLWSHMDPGGATDEPPLGDVFAATTVEGHVAALAGYTYGFLIDTRTGERTTAGLNLAGEHRLMPDVWAPAPGAVVPALETVRPPTGSVPQPGALRALDPVDGSVLWTAPEGVDWLVGVVGDGVLVGNETVMLYLDLATGQERWSVAAGSVLATDGERVLFAPRVDGRVSALSLADGSVTWSIGPPDGWPSPWISSRHLAVMGPDEVRMHAW